ncbi:uncharacterized protein [Haliotis asinina]|uniref:uncharacterized protein n=1 Tax=Haliotis asinina TaxID=109174 RepID=UPI0035320931
MRKVVRMLGSVAVLVVVVAVVAGGASLGTLFDQYYQWRLKESPEMATYLNVHDYDDELDKFGFGEMDFVKAEVDEFLVSLSKIDYNSLPRQQRYNYAVLNDTLTTMSQGYQWRMYGALTPISFLEGNQVDPGFLLQITPFSTQKDYEKFISRLAAEPQQLSDKISLMREAIRLGRTSNAVSMDRIPGEIDAMIKDDPSQFIFYRPFKTDINKLNLTHIEKTDLRARALNVSQQYIRALRQLKDFILKEYIPHARGTYGVGGLNQGGNYYAQVLKWHITVDTPPGRVHQIGLDEVARISKTMREIMQRQNFNGTIHEYFSMLSKEPRFHFKTADEIIARYQDLIYNRFYPALPKMFKNIPTHKVRVTKMATDGSPAQYMPGSSDGSREAEFQANVFRPNETDSYTMVGYALHEAVPGHHLQITRQQTSDLPDFRKEDMGGHGYSAPFSFPAYTAYIEGWALYAESLGEELGLYVDDYELMGRYVNEMFRACRLVVDTGIHFMGWTRDRAVNFFKQYSALSGGNLANEIDRYITWPGQACAYKIGELKIHSLREAAENALGSKFDIRDFHEVILSAGPVPLSLLETIVIDWISDTLKPTQMSTSGTLLATTSGQQQTTRNVPETTWLHATNGPVYTFTGQLPILPNIG